MEEKKKHRLTLIEYFWIVVILALILCCIIFPAKDEPSKEQVKSSVCGAYLKNLATAFLSYQEDDQFSTQWCDKLEKYKDDPNNFRCYCDRIGPCSYAVNENIPADANGLPGDLVLLFESTPGWNQIGGADDVVTDRHGKPGANIAFADGHVEFVEADKITTLRWTADEQKRGAGTTR